MDLVSQRKGAEALGIALSTLQYHVKRGNVSLIDGKVDIELARMQLAKHVNPEQSIRGKQNMGGRVPGDDDHSHGSPRLWEAKEQTERLRAELLELEVAEKRGELVLSADIQAAMAAKLTGAREIFLSLVDRLAPLLAAEPDQAKVHQLLSVEIRMAMRALAAEAPPSDN